MADILIRNLPGDTIRQAKALAVKHNRSLQQEISNLLIETVRFRTGDWSDEADTIRKRLARKGRVFSDSAKLIREDRDSR
jgi:hypothetical protein